MCPVTNTTSSKPMAGPIFAVLAARLRTSWCSWNGWTDPPCAPTPTRPRFRVEPDHCAGRCNADRPAPRGALSTCTMAPCRSRAKSRHCWRKWVSAKRDNPCPNTRSGCALMGLLAAMATEISKPALSHWTHTDALPAASHQELMCDASPNPLHVHPLPFRGPGTTQDQGIAGLVTFGAAAFIGREIRVRPT